MLHIHTRTLLQIALTIIHALHTMYFPSDEQSLIVDYYNFCQQLLPRGFEAGVDLRMLSSGKKPTQSYHGYLLQPISEWKTNSS